MDKKGDFAWGLSNTVTILLIVLALGLLLLLVYFFRDRIKDYLEVIIDFLRL